ncbi:hypothetical protein [Candidatus Uabimicrobium sp. HlEnr_7]|uniref:hypothetical protein n=1 Tax=Candidatus Uabimicrobium helgolandensis TaxID=3095367 RepID=UPI003556BB1D
MNDHKQKNRWYLILAVFVIVYTTLLYWLNGSSVFAVLTASGQNTPYSILLVAIIFIGLRLFLYLIVPGIVVAKISYVSFNWYIKTKYKN